MENYKPVAWVSEKELSELLNCNGMSIWAESPNVWQDVESEQLIPLFRYRSRTPRVTSEHDKEIIEKLENKIDRLEWENKGIAEWRGEYLKIRDMLAHLMRIAADEFAATPRLINAARSASFLLKEFDL